MPTKLSEPLEDQVRKYIVNNITPSEIQGYDPTQTDTTSSDFILVSSDNDDYGDYYPLIWVSEGDNGPTIPNSGDTNINGLQGDGSGPNQTAVKDVTVAVQAVQNGPYLNDTAYDQLVFEIYAELQSVFTNTTAISDSLTTGRLTPPTITRSSDQQDSSTESWIQRSGTVPITTIYTP